MVMSEDQRRQNIIDEKEKSKFAHDLLFEIKMDNLDASANLFNALWIHQRLSNWVVTVPSNPAYGPFQARTYTVNILNFLQTGDIDSVCYALIWGAADDMTEPDHWMSQARLDNIINSLKQFLGWP